jgi:hypothetical protein
MLRISPRMDGRGRLSFEESDCEADSTCAKEAEAGVIIGGGRTGAAGAGAAKVGNSACQSNMAVSEPRAMKSVVSRNQMSEIETPKAKSTY